MYIPNNLPGEMKVVGWGGGYTLRTTDLDQYENPLNTSTITKKLMYTFECFAYHFPGIF